ncbi:hypothetical protein HDU76_010205 [Blyttiomyces sp. JEL0837]|nr:hypothetical protein HDU76_010205 [Blyttiomyces sp. JEL0837]
MSNVVSRVAVRRTTTTTTPTSSPSVPSSGTNITSSMPASDIARSALLAALLSKRVASSAGSSTTHANVNSNAFAVMTGVQSAPLTTSSTASAPTSSPSVQQHHMNHHQHYHHHHRTPVTPQSQQRARSQRNPLQTPGIPWPAASSSATAAPTVLTTSPSMTTVDQTVSMHRGAQGMFSSSAAASDTFDNGFASTHESDHQQNYFSSSSFAGDKEEANSNGGNGDWSSYSSNAGAGYSSLIPFIPTALSAMCLAILAQSVNDTLRQRVHSNTVAAPVFVHMDAPAVMLQNDEEETSDILTMNIPIDKETQDEVEDELEMHVEKVVEAVTAADRAWDHNMHKISELRAEMHASAATPAEMQADEAAFKKKVSRVMGTSLAAIKLSLELLEKTNASNEMVSMKFQSDEQLLELLNEAYPPLRLLADDCAVPQSQMSHYYYAPTRDDEATRNSNHVRISSKVMVHDFNEMFGNVAQSAIAITSQWLSLSSLISYLLPASLRSELEFLGHYLSYCIEEETALDLPYLFPNDFETDHTGAVVKINRPISVFILRALARTAAGVAVALLPIIKGRRRPKLLTRRTSTLSMKRPDRKRIGSSESAAAFRAIPEEDYLPSTLVPIDSPVIPAAAEPDSDVKDPSPANPPLSSHIATKEGENPISQLSSLRVSVDSRDWIVDTLNRDMQPKSGGETSVLSPGLDARTLYEGSEPASAEVEDSQGDIKEHRLKDEFANMVGLGVSSEGMSVLVNEKAETVSVVNVHANEVDAEWEAFRIREAGIPEEILRLEFEAIRAGMDGPSVLVSDYNDLEMW